MNESESPDPGAKDNVGNLFYFNKTSLNKNFREVTEILNFPKYN